MISVIRGGDFRQVAECADGLSYLSDYEAMTPTLTTPGTQPPAMRPVRRALLAAALLVFAAVIAPICALMVACTMACCEGKSFPFVQSAANAACATHCGISNQAASHELPDAVAAPAASPQLALAALDISEASSDIEPTPPPQLPAYSVESHHAVPGDAPLYLYNSLFLI